MNSDGVYTRDLRGTPKPDYDSDSVGVGVGVGVRKTRFSGVGVGVGVRKTGFFGVGVGVGFFEKKFRSQIGVEVIITSDKILRFYEPVTIFFITINIKKDSTCSID